MLYLVTGENIENGQGNDPKEWSQLIETAVIPSLESMVKLEKEGKIRAGGLFAGARIGVVILEAESNTEVSRILRSLPFWGFLKWDITPLETFDDGVKETKEMLEQIKSLGR